ncbi:MAG: hypothetical protein N3G76_01605 [Candidatus Micrarchaeota archaeon]|nr:hypothetical protein [Candidatus Micrarchaeota archaeon]
MLGHATVVVNSLDGRDVVSGIYYAAVRGEDVVFIRPTYDAQLVYSKIGTNNNVLLIQSKPSPIITGMASELKNRGNRVELVESDDPYKTNLYLADRSGASKFILVDSVYGYNTVSVLAYAKLNSMYLVFVDKSNLGSVISFLKSKSPREILLYGYIDAESKKALDGAGIAYSEINNGDKFDDNLQIADMYFKKNPSKRQVIVSDGNAFEDTIAKGDDPVILVSPLPPVHVYDYIKQKAAQGQIKVLMIVDSEYTQTIYNLKTSINNELGVQALHAFVKIGESVSGSGGMGPVELFPLPGPVLGLTVESVQYNTLTKQLEVTYKNTGNALEYAKSQIRVFVDGNLLSTVGDDDFFALGRGEKVGRAYPISIESGEVLANMTVLYGTSRRAAETGFMVALPAGKVQFKDSSVLNISGFTLDKNTNDLYVTYTNTGGIPLYFRPDATVTANGISTKIRSDTVYSLQPGKGEIVKFPGIAKDGARIVGGANYGAREAFLEKRVEKEYVPAPSAQGIDTSTLLLVVVIVLVLLVGYLLLDKIRGQKQGAGYEAPARKQQARK